MATFVDRLSGYLLAVRLRDKTARMLNRAAARAFRDVPFGLRMSRTLDNGTEFAGHEKLAHELGMDVYFVDPYSSWQRGTNENSNGLLRQFLPKRTNFLELSPTVLAFHVAQLNNRPRKRLPYRTPAEVFQEARVALEM